MVQAWFFLLFYMVNTIIFSTTFEWSRAFQEHGLYHRGETESIEERDFLNTSASDDSLQKLHTAFLKTTLKEFHLSDDESNDEKVTCASALAHMVDSFKAYMDALALRCTNNVHCAQTRIDQLKAHQWILQGMLCIIMMLSAVQLTVKNALYFILKLRIR